MKKFYAIPAEQTLTVEENTVKGYAIVFNKLSVVRDGYKTIVRPGSVIFDEPVHCYKNHNPNIEFGMTGQNLTLAIDDYGVSFELKLPDTTEARDLKALMQPGFAIYTKCSFGCWVLEDSWFNDGETEVHELLQVKVDEITICSAPMFEDTSANLYWKQKRDEFAKQSKQVNTDLTEEEKMQMKLRIWDIENR